MLKRYDALLPLIVLAALVAAVGIYDPSFLSAGNFLEVTADTVTLFLMASGVTLVIMIGGIDLSVQAVASMTSCILAVYLPHLGFFAIPAAVLGGVIAGFLGGYVSTKLRIPSFIATLAVSGVVLSAGYWFSETRSVNIPGALSQKYLFWAVGDSFGVPNEIWVGHRDRANELLIRDPALLADKVRPFADYPGGHNEGYDDSFKICFRDFYGSIIAGRTGPLATYPTFADGHREILLCEAILKSQRESRWVTVGEQP